MCYEFESWHWKARAKEMHKAQSKTDARPEERSAPAKQETEPKRPEVREPVKVPA